MEKADLLAALNAECRRTGGALVTDRLLRDWIDEGLIAGASPTGRKRGENPLWTYSDTILAAATRVVELRSKGIQRVTLLRLYLWVERHLPISELVRRSLISEFNRFVRRQNRTQRVDYDARYQAELTDKEAAKVDRQLGRVDPDLEAAGLVPPSIFLRNFSSALVWEKSASLENDLAKILEGMGLDRIQADLSIELFAQGVSGMLGLSDETAESGADLISKECEIGDLEAAREFFELVILTISNGREFFEASGFAGVAWQKAERSLRTPDFLLAFLALGAISAIRTRKPLLSK